jgi:hypothetical protein
LHATHSNTLKRNKKRIGGWFIVQRPTTVTLTISKIGTRICHNQEDQELSNKKL